MITHISLFLKFGSVQNNDGKVPADYSATMEVYDMLMRASAEVRFMVLG